MKSPAKKIITAIISGIVLLNAGLSFAQSNEIIFYHNEETTSASDKESAERKREFWEKFRQSVTPKPPPAKAPPRPKDPPKEVKPEEKRPQEVKPEEVKPEKVETEKVE